jgi:multicomponent Na+:H+ antiporter subunit D
MNSTLMDTVTLAGNLSWDMIFGGAFLALLISVGLYAKAVPQGKGRWWGLAALLGVLVLAGQAVGPGWARMLLLDAAAFAAVGLVWIQSEPEVKAAAKTYLVLLALSVICLAAGQYFGAESEVAPAFPLDKIVVALYVIGFGLKLALVPFYFWLPGVAEHTKPMTTALIVSIVDIAAFGELIQLRISSPWVFTSYTALWLTLALLSMFVGALLALAQRSLKRMLAYSTIDDMGYLLLGVLIGSQVSLTGAILAALSHAFFKVVLFGAVGIAEYRSGHEITLDDCGLAASYPVSSAAFIAGALGMIGVPPLFGFVGRWRLYLSGVEFGGIALALAMAAATALALLYYVRVIHRVWLGKPEEGVNAAGEPKLAAAVLIVLVVLMLAAGLFPGWLTGLIG